MWEWGPLVIVTRGLRIALASFVAEHRLPVHGLWWLQRVRAVAVVCGLRCSAACGIFPDQGLSLCPLHWQAGSYPLHHQGGPSYVVFVIKFT